MLFALLYHFFTECNTKSEKYTNSAWQVVTKNPDLSLFESLAKGTEMENYLKTIDGFTLFVPNNEAIEKAQEQYPTYFLSKTFVQRILMYHLIQKALPINHIQHQDIALTFASISPNSTERLSLFFSRDSNHIFVNKAQIISPDYLTENGVVHIIDQLLLPPNNMYEQLAAINNLSSMTKLIELLSLISGLQASTNNYTIFAPSNEAFNQLSSTLDNPVSFLLCHMLPQHYTYNELKNKTIVTIIEKYSLHFNYEEGILTANDTYQFIEPTMIPEKSLRVSNGEIFVINQLLAPPVSVEL